MPHVLEDPLCKGRLDFSCYSELRGAGSTRVGRELFESDYGHHSALFQQWFHASRWPRTYGSCAPADSRSNASGHVDGDRHDVSTDANAAGADDGDRPADSCRPDGTGWRHGRPLTNARGRRRGRRGGRNWRCERGSSERRGRG